jgi:formylglycine-generating enzyme required for sulfatase activity
MVVVPTGSFTMGSPGDEKGRFRDEAPVHNVRIEKPFAVGKFDLTRGEYASFEREARHVTGSGCRSWNGSGYQENRGTSWRDPGYTQADNHPVVCISWDDAKAYVEWLAEKTGRQYRLLTEAEWEYAARAQTKPGQYPRFFFGNDESSLCTYGKGADGARCNDGIGNATVAVGQYKPNNFGLYDVLGNAWEWTEDCYHDSYAGVPTDGSAWAVGRCNSRVLRGGAWDFGPRYLRSANRGSYRSDQRLNDAGFRVARALND